MEKQANLNPKLNNLKTKLLKFLQKCKFKNQHKQINMSNNISKNSIIKSWMSKPFNKNIINFSNNIKINMEDNKIIGINKKSMSSNMLKKIMLINNCKY
jgi:hypothetical protein